MPFAWAPLKSPLSLRKNTTRTPSFLPQDCKSFCCNVKSLSATSLLILVSPSPCLEYFWVEFPKVSKIHICRFNKSGFLHIVSKLKPYTVNFAISPTKSVAFNCKDRVFPCNAFRKVYEVVHVSPSRVFNYCPAGFVNSNISAHESGTCHWDCCICVANCGAICSTITLMK